MNLYISLADIKIALGISSSTYDTKINMYNQLATSVVNDYLNARDLDLHLVTDEVRDSRGRRIQLKDPNVVAVGRLLNNGVEYTQNDEFDIVSDTVILESPIYSGDRKLKATYAAGWRARRAVKLTISDVGAMAAAATITINDVNVVGQADIVLTRGTSWTAANNATDEATNIAGAINGLSNKDFQAFSCGKFVFIQDKALGGLDRPVSSSDSVRLNFENSTTSADFPEPIKLAVCLYVSNLLNSIKSPRVKQYTIGAKSVTFSDSAQFVEFKNLLNSYKRAKVYII